MAVRLGELLVKKRIITREQLLDALEAQVVYGSRLGTSLIELGYVAEDTLSAVLSQQLNIPFVKPERLRSIPPHVLNRLPREIVEKYRALPLGSDEGVLRLGMSPPDPETISEISRITGYSIVPFVITEIRLSEALEHYYGIPRDPRLATTTRRLDSERDKRAHRAVGPQTPEDVLTSAQKDLDNALNRDDVAHVALGSSLVFVRRAALFLHKGSYIQGWTGQGEDLTDDGVRRVEIPANVPSIFKTVSDSKQTLHAAVPDEPFTKRALTLMGGTSPGDIVLSPVPIRGRVLVFLYGDNSDKGGVPEQHKDFIESLSGQIGRSFERLIFAAGD